MLETAAPALILTAALRQPATALKTTLNTRSHLHFPPAECLNMAALYKLPHIFVVENNKWAIGMSHPRATSATAGDDYPMIWKKGEAFGMHGVHVDGMDVLKVRLGEGGDRGTGGCRGR